jgi:uncharacterized protein (DUF1697 family)
VRQVALLRAVNLASKRRVGMAELRGLVEGLGYRDVVTVLQSGNLVFASDKPPTAVTAELEATLRDELGLDIPILVRTGAELKRVVSRDPLGELATDGSRYLVTFLSDRLAPAVARELEQTDVAPERIIVAGREIYLWLPNGFQRARAPRLLKDDKLGVVSTTRNWNTVKKLLELATSD